MIKKKPSEHPYSSMTGSQRKKIIKRCITTGKFRKANNEKDKQRKIHKKTNKEKDKQTRELHTETTFRCDRVMMMRREGHTPYCGLPTRVLDQLYCITYTYANQSLTYTETSIDMKPTILRLSHLASHAIYHHPL